ncbi:efflux RND transporter periplasmic adaptor subunit [Williamwhitmania taraxaci]|uniref:Membrane fusion protein, multidrug efflux system n=1 Tax=Williamwhitmania taraxaci TaxID=1640674 RepID=A0A1G6MJS2_9BACT|nr:efflux RND transporter periplasmic adaptor subunit [Williamwhitmania taraxaci]SDC55215.1 membrane fusion protein, multidrug efflux system [Williamwhitmania taraxaci]
MRLKQLFVGSAILMAIGLSSCGESKKQSGGPGKGGKGPVMVDVILVESKTMERNLVVAATILPNETVELQTETSGKLISLNLNEGALVTQGTLLAQINDSEIKAKLQKLKLDEKLAADDEGRKKKLLDMKALSQQDYDAALNNLEGIRADIALAKAQQEKTQVRAPFSGRIGLRKVSPGAYVSTNTTIATLVQDNPLKVEFSVPERIAPYIKNGLQIELAVGEGKATQKAVVYATESSIDQSTRSLTVRARCSNNSGRILPGSFAKVSLSFQNLPNMMAVPPQALYPTLNTQNVFILKNGVAKLTPVVLGDRTSTEVEISSGISVGDSLIISGLNTIKDSMAVKAIGAKGSKPSKKSK